MKNEYSRQVELLCPICGCSQFKFDDEIEDSSVTCLECGKTYSRDELSDANQENLELHQKEMGEEVFKDLTKDLQKSMKKAFGKNFKIK